MHWEMVMTSTVERNEKLNDTVLDILFREARTLRKWQSRPVGQELLRELYDLAKLGPTGGNLSPARFVFLTTEESKARLLPLIWEGNREQTRTAPVVALVAYDLRFYEKVDRLAPYRDPKETKATFEADPDYTQFAAMQSSSLQGAYLMIAARALGLDVGPMGGFDADGINAAFFGDSSTRINFVCNIGYGDRSGLRPRLPRLDFAEAATVL